MATAAWPAAHDGPLFPLEQPDSPPEIPPSSEQVLHPAPESPERAITELEREVSFLARRMARGTNLEDDLKQEGLWAVVNAFPRYRNDGPASFAWFAMICAKARMLGYLQREGLLPANSWRFANTRYQVSRRIVSGDAPISEESDDISVFDGVPAELSFIEKPDNRALVHELRDAVAALPGRERECAHLFLEDLQEVEIAARLGVSRQRVNQIIGGALARLRRRLVPQAVRSRLRRKTKPRFSRIGRLSHAPGRE